MEGLLKLIKTMNDELNENVYIDLLNSNIAEIDSFNINDINEIFKISQTNVNYLLEDSLLTLEIIGGLNCYWVEKDQNIFSGGFQNYGFSENLWGGSQYFKKYPGEINYKKKIVNKSFVKIFQKSNFLNSQDMLGCFYNVDNTKFETYFFDSGFFCSMDMSIDSYYKTMIENKAILGWQYFYIDSQCLLESLINFSCVDWIPMYMMNSNCNRLEGLKIHMDLVINKMNLLFPEIDTSFHQKMRNKLN